MHLVCRWAGLWNMDGVEGAPMNVLELIWEWLSFWLLPDPPKVRRDTRAKDAPEKDTSIK